MLQSQQGIIYILTSPDKQIRQSFFLLFEMSARIRLRPHINTPKNCFTCFFLPSTRIGLLPISKTEQLIWGNKKNIPKKTRLFQRQKYIFQATFFLSTSLTFLKTVQKFFYFVTLINFSRNLPDVFFIWSPLLTFPKIGSMFFSSMFFLPSLVRFQRECEPVNSLC